MTILLIACGNPLRRDDGAGGVLARRLAAERLVGLRILILHQLTPELAVDLARPEVRCALFADAFVVDADADAPILRPLDGEGGAPPLGHHLCPESLLGLTARLYGRRPPAWLAAIPGEDFGFGEGLSLEAQRAVARAHEQIRDFLSRQRDKPPEGESVRHA